MNFKKKTRVVLDDDEVSDSERNPPLIRLSQANMTCTDTETQQDEEDPNIPFFNWANTNFQHETDDISYSSDATSIKIPNAQPVKYGYPANVQEEPTTTDKDDEVMTDSTTDSSGQFKKPLSPSPIPKATSSGNEQVQQHEQPNNFPMTSTPKESVDGAYSLVSRSMKLSTL